MAAFTSGAMKCSFTGFEEKFFDDAPIARLRFDVAPLGTRASWPSVKIWDMKAGGLGDG
jgi:hypothetical protein